MNDDENKNEEVAQEAAQEEEQENEQQQEKKGAKKAKKKNDSQDELQELGEKLSELNDKYMRTLAEYDNYRKRTAKEKDAVYADTKAQVVKELLPVLDNLTRANQNSGADFETYKKGVDMICTQLTDAFKKLGVESFGEVGETFDPNIHNGVMRCEDEELGENVIAEVFIKGYRLGDRIIREATVKVAN